jgi:N-acetylmuramoyl-L-alanine amidase
VLAASTTVRRHLQLLFVALLLLGLSPAAEEKKLAVYTPQTSYTISVTDRYNVEYVSLTDLVDPLGKATLTHKGARWKLRLATGSGSLDAEFTDGTNLAKIRGKQVSLASVFWTDGQRGYVPVASTPVLMVHFARHNAALRENSRRLFVGDVSTTYTAEIAKSAPNKLVLHFSAPVNPTVATEPGRVRLTFDDEPLIPSGANPQPFESPAIRSVAFSENNGAAELNIATNGPTQTEFSDGGRTITLTTSLPPPVAQAPPPTPTTPTPQTPTAPQPGTPVTQAPAVARMVVIIDPAHGGDDPGAALGNGLLEKDVTLAIARRVRADLDQHGITAVLLRDGDATLTLDQRAVAANASHAAAYIAIHATSFGTGVHLYSARFNNAVTINTRPFLPWDSAQAAYLALSHNLEASLVTEFDSRQIHSIPLESGLRPLRNIAKAAIAVEVAEPATVPENVENGLTSVAYQQAVASAIASGIANMSSALGARR